MSEYPQTLVSRDGRRVTAHTPGEANDLRYGQGYRLVDDEPEAGVSPVNDAEPAPQPTPDRFRKAKSPEPEVK